MGMRYELVYSEGTLTTRSGQVLMSGTLDACAAEFEGVTIRVHG